MQRNILITGGTGLIGSYLTNKLNNGSFNIFILTRSKSNPAKNLYYWNIDNEEIDEAILNVAKFDAIVHLAGAGIAEKPWSNSRKQLILNSRLKTLKFLESKLNDRNIEVGHLIGAGGIDFYEAENTSELTSTFLRDVSLKWHEVVIRSTLGVHKSVLHIPIVLAKNGGFMAQIKKGLSFKAVPIFGKGRNAMNWVHISDLVKMIESIIVGKLPPKIYIAAAPKWYEQKKFMKQIKQKYKAWFLFSIPKFILKLIFGEMSNALLVSHKEYPSELIKEGFEFEFKNLKDALKNLKTV